MYTVDNAVIMAAGTASRFAPLSYENPKALAVVKGEVLIERQIRQLQEAGIDKIYIVVGYQASKFVYLEEKFQVVLIENPYYLTRNNNASIYAVKDLLKNTYICSSDNYFAKNPFEKEVSECYYAAVYSDGFTKEWCMEHDETGRITSVNIGGENSWYMLGHTFWSEKFSRKFVEILLKEYEAEETRDLLWESIFINHIEELEMYIRKYDESVIFEFDTLDELRAFDNTYLENTRSELLKDVAKKLQCRERDITYVFAYKDDTNEAAGFTFMYNGKSYRYSYDTKEMEVV